MQHAYLAVMLAAIIYKIRWCTMPRDFSSHPTAIFRRISLTLKQINRG